MSKDPLVVPSRLKLLYYSRALEGKICRPVTKADTPLLDELILKMFAFVKEHDGVGLAAPQVGIFLRLAVMLDENDSGHVLINPRITAFGGSDLVDAEGCLSIPPATRAQARVTRSEIIHLESGTLDDPDACETTKHKGLEARIVQHELDHLDGIFFINRVSNLQRELVLQRHRKWLKRQETVAARRLAAA